MNPMSEGAKGPVRCINISDAAHGKPSAVDRLSIPSYIPLESDALGIALTAIRPDDTPGIFGRQAQACHLLHLATDLHQRQETAQQGSFDNEKNQIDGDIRHLLEILIDQNSGSICEYCEATAIVIAQVSTLPQWPITE
jgi:hypothetical protein